MSQKPERKGNFVDEIKRIAYKYKSLRKTPALQAC